MAGKLSSFLFIRAYHRALDKGMSIQELAKKLGVSTLYISGKRAYLSRLLGIRFPALPKKDKTTDKTTLRRMLVDCHRIARQRNRPNS